MVYYDQTNWFDWEKRELINDLHRLLVAQKENLEPMQLQFRDQNMWFCSDIFFVWRCNDHDRLAIQLNTLFVSICSCTWRFHLSFSPTLYFVVNWWCDCRYLMGSFLLYQKMESYSTTKKWNQNKSPALGILLVESLCMQQPFEAIGPVRFAEKTSRNTVPVNLLREKNTVSANSSLQIIVSCCKSSLPCWCVLTILP